MNANQRCCFLVIDMLVDFFDRSASLSGQRKRLVMSINELAGAFGDRIIVKKRYSAFFQTNLEELLAELGAGMLVVAGINTHACVRTSVIDAYQRDLDVVVASDCIGSHDEEHHDVTVRYLDGKMARFMNNEAIMTLIKHER